MSKNQETDKLLSMRLEQLTWEAVKDSKDPDELQAFVNACSNGFFGDLARLRLARIRKAAEAQVANLETRKILVEKSLRKKLEEQVKTAVLKDTKTTHPKVMTREATREIQAELNRLGCVAGRPDGLWGRKSTRAVIITPNLPKFNWQHCSLPMSCWIS
ncbi:MAG: peptidoglycan-binding protein [Hyphomicrobiales bacterium]|nr:peptidoglycan-binding protein [Hyphomicrobiales bacterium]